jgi:hypothetical protein
VSQIDRCHYAPDAGSNGFLHRGQTGSNKSLVRPDPADAASTGLAGHGWCRSVRSTPGPDRESCAASDPSPYRRAATGPIPPLIIAVSIALADTVFRLDATDDSLIDASSNISDALHVAAEHLAGPQLIADLDQSADRLLKRLTGEPAWPTLRSRLLLLAAAGADPVADGRTDFGPDPVDCRPLIRPNPPLPQLEQQPGRGG